MPFGFVVRPDRSRQQHHAQTGRAQFVFYVEAVVAQRVGRDAVGQHPADDLAALSQTHAVVLERRLGAVDRREAALVPLAFSALRVVPLGHTRRFVFGQLGPGEDLEPVGQHIVVHPRSLDDGGEVGHADQAVQRGRAPVRPGQQGALLVRHVAVRANDHAHHAVGGCRAQSEQHGRIETRGKRVREHVTGSVGLRVGGCAGGNEEGE